MQISGIVILYHPNEEEVIRNMMSYINYVNALFVFDNSGCNTEFIERVKDVSTKIEFVSNKENEGIAKPINKALRLVKDKWLLTMDQDSYFEQEQAFAFFNFFERLFSQMENIAIVCPEHSEFFSNTINEEYREVRRAITSGSIINTKICQELNGFDEKLFIDEVDFEYCYRCVLAGHKIMQFSNIYLNHSIGTLKQAGYFSIIRKANRSLHSPLRIYYMVRNFSYVSSKYKKLLPHEIKQRRKELLVMLKNNLFFSGKFFTVLFCIVRGYLHFKLNKFSS